MNQCILSNISKEVGESVSILLGTFNSFKIINGYKLEMVLFILNQYRVSFKISIILWMPFKTWFLFSFSQSKLCVCDLRQTNAWKTLYVSAGASFPIAGNGYASQWELTLVFFNSNSLKCPVVTSNQRKY